MTIPIPFAFLIPLAMGILGGLTIFIRWMIGL